MYILKYNFDFSNFVNNFNFSQTIAEFKSTNLI